MRLEAMRPFQRWKRWIDWISVALWSMKPSEKPMNSLSFFIGILESEGIGLSDIRTLKDTFSITLKDGQLTVSGPYKEHIEGYLRDHPEVDKKVKDALKEVLVLNALIALKEVNERYLQDKSKAEKIADPEKREEALKKTDAQHLERSNMLQSLSGTMTFSNGAFSSTALNYIRVLPV